ncbi:hypothetical protein [Alkalilimnicola ehrlichii]|uniref:hypothetical protein n=1 Tax=Alkalilimnicola ehrlichii TaxID=351052 RepID=UPI0021637D8F|nr:hypothetical protein [Alkalilimnicola ehrlichii]
MSTLARHGKARLLVTCGVLLAIAITAVLLVLLRQGGDSQADRPSTEVTTATREVQPPKDAASLSATAAATSGQSLREKPAEAPAPGELFAKDDALWRQFKLDPMGDLALETTTRFAIERLLSQLPSQGDEAGLTRLQQMVLDNERLSDPVAEQLAALLGDYYRYQQANDALMAEIDNVDSLGALEQLIDRQAQLRRTHLGERVADAFLPRNKHVPVINWNACDSKRIQHNRGQRTNRLAAPRTPGKSAIEPLRKKKRLSLTPD